VYHSHEDERRDEARTGKADKRPLDAGGELDDERI